MSQTRQPIVLTERGEAVADALGALAIVVSIVCFVAIFKMLGFSA